MDITFDTPVYFKGRHGMYKARGINIFIFTDKVSIRPVDMDHITSDTFIDVPKSAIPALIEKLKNIQYGI